MGKEREIVASLSKDGSGWRILFVCPTTKKRRTIRTGKCAKKNATTALNMIEQLIQSKVLGAPHDQRTSAWLASIDGKLRERLAKAGLCEATQAATLGEFLDGYIDQRRRRGDIEESTLTVWGHTKRNLLDFFGNDKDMRRITTFDADEWCAWLVEDQGLAENTIAKRVQVTKSLFKVAVRRKIVSENPFVDLNGTAKPVTERQFFIPRETVTTLLDQCNGPEYRLLLTVARYMGVRVPSEIVPLKWSDVNWENSTIVITSPKTKRHRGGESRVCPIFPEVMPALQAAWDDAPEGAVHIFPSIRSGKKNLRTWLQRAILQAGLSPWPRLWQNFRATRATELADQFPSHVAAAWLGHTEQIANRHYRQVTAEHLERATSQTTGAQPVGTSLAQKPAHSPLVAATQGSSGNEKSPTIPRNGEAWGGMQAPQVAEEGFEPPTRGL